MSPRRYALLGRSGFGELVLTQVALISPLVPAKAGTQFWIPAFAGMSGIVRPLALGVTLAVALGLSGCGRAGPLELPPGPAAAPSAQLSSPGGPPVPGSAEDPAVKTGFDAQGNPVAAPGERKSFILDPILRYLCPPGPR